MSLEINKTNLNKLADNTISAAKKYGLIIFIITGLLISSYLILSINNLLNKEPSEASIAEKSKLNQATKIDESAVNTIKDLRSANVEVKTLFEQSRDNPFQE